MSSVNSDGTNERSVSPREEELMLNPFHSTAFCLASVPLEEIVAIPPDPYDLMKTLDCKESSSARVAFEYTFLIVESLKAVRFPEVKISEREPLTSIVFILTVSATCAVAENGIADISNNR